MIEAKILLPVALAALVLYAIDNIHRLKQLKADDTPDNRASFFAEKIKKQFVVILGVPTLCLIISNKLGQALNPGPMTGDLAAQITAMTGLSRRDLVSLISLRRLIEVSLGILVLEALPLLFKSKSSLVVGDISVLLPRSGIELVWCAILALVAGVGEELLFRGFIPLGITGFNVPLEGAFLVSVIVFGAVHVYQGPVGVLMTGVIGALLTATYLLTSSLLFVIVIHVAIDVVGLVLRPLTRMGLRRFVSVAAM